jgi:outer membrane autotransporter protein
LKTFHLNKTLIAMAIAAATTTVATQAMAVPAEDFVYSLSSGALDRSDETWSNVTLSGSISASDAVHLGGNTVLGNFTNNATISTGGIDFDQSDATFSPSRIDGNFVNNGTISATGQAAVGVMLDPLFLRGDFINTGSISASGAYDPVDDAGAHAIDGDGTFSGSGIDGNFRNQGSLSASGEKSKALYLENLHLGGDLINSGSITASGANSKGIYLEEVNFGGVLNNSGTISASGVGATAIDIDQTNLLAINNSGTIRATGTDATGIFIDAAKFEAYEPAEHRNVGIVNSGTIVADGVAIDVLDNFKTGSAPLQINQKDGLISGGSVAINGGGAVLNWSGGKIKGNILDIGEVNIVGDATFEGTEIQTGYVDLSTGKLSLVGPHTTITGNLEMAAGTVLELFLGNNTNAATPVLTVSGYAEFDPNSKIQLQANSSDFRTASGGTEYKLLSAGSIVGGNNLNVSSSSALLEVKSFSVTGNQVKAVVASKSDAAVIAAVNNAGGSSNAAAAVVPLANTLLGRLSESDPLFIAFANAGSDAQLAALAKQLTPEVNGGGSQAAKTGLSLVKGAVGARSSAVRSGLSSGDLLAETGVWAQALTSDATQDARKDVSGYDADSNGIAIGADGKLNKATTLGLAYSYIATDVNSGGGNKTEVTGNALTAYGNWTQGNWFVDGASTYGWNGNDAKRSIAGTQAKADYDSEFLGLNALVGYSYRIDKNLIIEPQIGARYTNISIDSYAEKGSSAALSVGAQRYEIGELGAGVRLAAAFDLGKGSLEPQAKVMAWHDLIADEVSSTSTFVLGGTPFTTTGSGSVRDSYELGLGLDYKLDAWTVGGSYDYLAKTAFNADTFTAKVRYDF